MSVRFEVLKAQFVGYSLIFALSEEYPGSRFRYVRHSEPLVRRAYTILKFHVICHDDVRHCRLQHSGGKEPAGAGKELLRYKEYAECRGD